MPDQVWVQELQKAYGALLKKKRPETPHILLQRDTYLRAALLGQWDALSNEASQQRDRAAEGLRELTPIQRELESLRNKVVDLVEEAKSVWTPLQGRADWSDVRQTIQEKLEGEATPAKAAALMKKLGALRMSDMSNRILAPIHSMAANLDEASESWHALAVGAELAQSVSAFHKHTRVRLKETRKLNEWLAESAATLQGYEKEIWQALRTRDLKQLRTVSTALLRWVSGDTLDEATKQASALARARESGTSRWTLGKQAIATGELVRGLLLGQALARRTAWMAESDLGAAKEWCDAAARLAFPSRWRPSAVLKLGAIWSRGRQLAGKLVTVEGVVGHVSNVHVRRKVHSSAWIADPDGTSVRVGITHIKMDSGGVVEGAYARITGTFVPMDKDFGTPIIRVDQRTYTDDSKWSWSDWKALRLRRLYTPVPHGLTLAWSWEHGEYGAGNQLRYGTWLPFERGD